MAREEEERQRWEKHKDAEQRAKLLKEEQQRKAALETKAADWKKASMIREYVAAVISANADKTLNINEKALASWKKWALAHAQELDPIASGNPLIDLVQPVDEEDEDEDEFESEDV